MRWSERLAALVPYFHEIPPSIRSDALSRQPSLILFSLGLEDHRMFDPVSSAFSGAIGLVVGGAVGWFGHKLAGGRDRATRLRTFLAFMDQWRSEVERADILELAEEYARKVHSFRGEAAKVRDDFRDRQRFDSLVQQLSSFGRSQINVGPINGRDLIATHIDAVVEFTRKA
jgi:hypothetical protein